MSTNFKLFFSNNKIASGKNLKIFFRDKSSETPQPTPTPSPTPNVYNLNPQAYYNIP